METNGVSETEEKAAEAPVGQLQRSVAAAEQLVATLSEEARVSAMAGTVGEIYEEHCDTVNAAVQRYLHSLESNALLRTYATTIMLRHEFDLASGMFQWNPAGFYSKLERLHIRMIDYEQEKAEFVMQGRIEDEALILQKILIEMESIPMGEAARVLERHVLPILHCDPIKNILRGHLRSPSDATASQLSMINAAAAKVNILWSNTKREFGAAVENILNNGNGRLANCHDDTAFKLQLPRIVKDAEKKCEEEYRNQEIKLDTFFDGIIGVKETSLKEWKSFFVKQLKDLEVEHCQDTKRKLTEVCDERRKQIVEKEKVSYLSDEMLSRIKGFVDSQNKSGQLEILIDMPEDKLKDVFLDKWYEWLSELKKSNPTTQEVISVKDIERDAFNVLCERFPNNLRQLLMRTTESGRQLRQFSIQEFKANRSHYTMTDMAGEGSTIPKQRRWSRISRRTTTQKPSELPTSEIDALAHQLITEAKTFLDLHLRQPQEYNKSAIYTALTKLQWSPNDKFQVTSMFELDLAMAFSGYAIRQLYDQHNRFLKANDPVLVLEDHLNHYFSVFTTMLKKKDAQSSTIQALLKSLESSVKETVTSNVIDSITDLMITDTHRKQLVTKFSCINNVLASLALEENFAKFQEYLKTPQLAIDSYLRALVRDCCIGKNERGKLGNVLEKLILQLLASAKVVFNEKKVGAVTFNQWLDDVEKGLKPLLVLKGLEAVRSAAECMDNFSAAVFTESLLSQLVGVEQRLVRGVVGAYCGEEAGGAVERAVAARLRAVVVGCEARCPFCLEPCGYADDGHVAAVSPGADGPPTRHATRPGPWGGHKPAGCLGYRDVHTRALSTATCGERVARPGDLTFANADTGMRDVKYADYTSMYPDWAITADHAAAQSGEGSYWKWFMCHYNKDLAKLYASKPANIPEAWKSLTREGEIRKLLKEE